MWAGVELGSAGVYYVAQDRRDDTGDLGVLEGDGISAYTVRSEAWLSGPITIGNMLTFNQQRILCSQKKDQDKAAVAVLLTNRSQDKQKEQRYYLIIRHTYQSSTFHVHLPATKPSKTKTYNSGYSLVVTHLTTNPPVHCLSTAERTGSSIFSVLWSYVEEVVTCLHYIAIDRRWQKSLSQMAEEHINTKVR
jgi:hypothetical protein